MPTEYITSENVYRDRDAHDAVRALAHFGAPFISTARTPQLVAAEYLQRYADLLEVPASSLEHLSLRADPEPTDASMEFRFLGEKHQDDSATVAFQQTVLGLPVWQAGLAVQMGTDPPRVLSSQSTAHHRIEVVTPDADVLARAKEIGEAELARSLGLTGGAEERGSERESLKIERRELVVFRFERGSVQRDDSSAESEGAPGEAQVSDGQNTLPRLPLPPVPEAIADGRHFVCLKVDFRLQTPGFGPLNWVAVLEVASLAVLYLRPFVDTVTGLVFEVDPVTTNGGPLPSGTNVQLNAVAVAELLEGLSGPVSGKQSLAGDNVALSDFDQPPTVAPPTKPSGTNFDFDARTDNFAAVNAYEHCDRFLRLTTGMGFTKAGYFGGTAFPTPVDHRGRFYTANGIEVNAYCAGTSSGSGIDRTSFMLADIGDTSNPIGIACDYRVVLHELAGHGVLYNHVSSANFRFSHSAGDSVGAILSDPGTQAADRFLTFPWVSGVIDRRHDRLPSGGWGYGGSIALNPFSSLDGGGYNNEQILSSTMFRIYRSLGGDSWDLNTQRFAARMTVYLILKAIGTLSPATNPASGEAFAAALQTADASKWVSENLAGGAYRKVIRWAFEKQGAYQPAGASTPNNNIGAPPAVDVYIDDGRAGEYQYQPNFWETQAIWNRLAADGSTAHQVPEVNTTNYAYVKIKNRGTQVAKKVVVKAYHGDPNAGLSYPSDWSAMTTASINAPNVPANNTAEVVVGPFAWVPQHIGHECMLMVVSATGDESNVDHITPGDSMSNWRLIPHDNNIAQRNVVPVTGNGAKGLMEAFEKRSFQLKNPMAAASRMKVSAALPEMLASRGWRLEFANPGGAAFSLGAGEARDIMLQLVPGADFTAEEVYASQNRTIVVTGYADGILVGGMSYQLDPDLASEPGHRDRRAEFERRAETLVERLDFSQQRVRRVAVRRVTLDLELEDPDD
ncbi:hypothetical protein ACIRPT_26730 [Streptomyces sp. NPDC101227]|uniref:hypothetical protein n=1 Tax=Streptomyces sp. NPDC101227 TaxID=3366136 RepID=UPI0038258F0D